MTLIQVFVCFLGALLIVDWVINPKFGQPILIAPLGKHPVTVLKSSSKGYLIWGVGLSLVVGIIILLA